LKTGEEVVVAVVVDVNVVVAIAVV